MGALVTGYDLLMVLWGTVFVLAAAGFLYAMNRVFVLEEHRQEGASPAPAAETPLPAVQQTAMVH
jgi:membrane glycosyltransferase